MVLSPQWGQPNDALPFMAPFLPQARRRFTLLLLAGWGLIAALAALALRLLKPLLPTATPSPLLLVEPARAFLAPEPLERAVFLPALVLVPLLLLAFVLGAVPVAARRQPGWSPGWLEALLTTAIALLLFWPLPQAPAIRALSGAAGFSAEETLGHVFLCLFSSAVLVFLTIQSRRPGWRRRRPLLALAMVCALLAALGGLLSFRVFGFSHLTDSAVWWDHLDAVVSAIAQVRAGGTLLADTPSQYGLYPELLAPLLRLLPPGVLALTLVFAAVQLLSLLSLMLVLRRRIRQPIVLACALFALAMMTFGLNGLIGFRLSEPDPYFQYWPVRFLGPALSIPLCFWLFRRLSWRRLALLAAFTGLCLFANLDSGVAVLYALTMLLVLLSGLALAGRRWGRWRWRSLALASGVFPLASLLSFALLLLLLRLKAGEPLQLAWLTGFQSTFYAMGVMMLPLPPWPDAWHVVLGVYTLGLILALAQLRAGRPLGPQLPLLYLPLLGAGLFTYFQGRSHFFNLVGVSWPAVLIAALLTDRHLLALRQRWVPRSTFPLPVVGLTALLIPALALLQDATRLVQRSSDAPPQAPYLQTEREMVRRFCGPGQPPCLLLSKRQGIYALEAGTASAWRGPSPAELLLEADRQRLLAAIAAGRPARLLLGVGPSALPSLALTPEQLPPLYRRAASNREGTLVLFLRRGTAEPPGS